MPTQLDESPFSFDELFFSKTDTKGLLSSGNTVFQRVSEFDWKELLGKPHNIIRHHDMPRAVFFILWKFLKNGKSIGAFVKNKSKSGRYYWVYALAMPIEGGYLSVRLKPGGDLLKTIASEYETIANKERALNLKPEQSAELLINRLNELGFKDYDSFMTEALVDQLLHRSMQLKIDSSKELNEMTRLVSTALETVQSSQKILRAFKEAKFVPLNLEICAEKRGEKGRQISVVANQYQKIVIEINKQIEKFKAISDKVANQVNEGRFQVGSSELLREVRRYIEDENKGQTVEGLHDIDKLVTSYSKSSEMSVQEIINVVREFASVCENLQVLGSGLQLVRLTGKIESASLDQSSDITEMLNSLGQFQLSLSSGLKEILTENVQMKDQAHHLLHSLVNAGPIYKSTSK